MLFNSHYSWFRFLKEKDATSQKQKCFSNLINASSFIILLLEPHLAFPEFKAMSKAAAGIF